MQRHILEQAAGGGVVIMGRGGNFLLKDISHAYRIRVQAPIEARIERVVTREGVDQQTARWLCDKTDSERSCFLHAIYGKRWDDPAEYDRVFDAGQQEVDAIVLLVREQLEKQRTPGFSYLLSTWCMMGQVLCSEGSRIRRRSTKPSKRRPGSLPGNCRSDANCITGNSPAGFRIDE